MNIARFLFLATLLAGGCAAYKDPPPPCAPPSAPATTEKGVYLQTARLAALMELLHEHYADEKSSEYDRLFEGALRGMLQTLDPYSVYLPKKEHDKTQRSFAGERSGFGISLLKNTDQAPRVTMVLPDSPADRAGVQIGDLILEIAGKATSVLTAEECLALLSHDREGVSLLVRRATEGTPISLKLKRTAFTLHPVPTNAQVILPKHIGYLRIDFFNAATALEFRSALKRFEERGVKALILDLRNNPGGLVGSAGEVVSHFLPSGSLVLRSVGRNKVLEELKTTVAAPLWLEQPLVLLVNERSASSAEIVTGALQDAERARVIGEKTFGKGSIQRILPLPEGDSVRFSIARYHTPKGRLLDGVGIVPDERISLSPRDSLLLAEQMQAFPAVVFPVGRDNPVRDTQLAAALAYLEKKLPETATP